MHLEDARSAIATTLDRMNGIYREPVFNEWVLVSLRRQEGAILAYTGPRSESYKKEFIDDIRPLAAEIEGQKLAVGDFAFAREATGTKFDVCMRVGNSSYVFCNHTGKTMAEIRNAPRWIEAQKPFVALSERFRADPLE